MMTVIETNMKSMNKKAEMAKKMYDQHGKTTGYGGGMKADMHGKNTNSGKGMKHDMHGKNTGYGKGEKNTQYGDGKATPKFVYTQHGSGSSKGGGMGYTM